MIKYATTPEKKQEVFDWLRAKGTTPNSEHLYYLEENGEIVGAYAIEHKVCVDPLQANSPRIALELFSDAIATARTLSNKIYMVSNEDKVKKALQERYGAILWSKDVDEFLINL